MTPQEKELYNKEVRPFFDDWQEAEHEYHKYLKRFIVSLAGKGVNWNEVPAITIETVKKIDQLEKVKNEKEKKHEEAFKKWLNSF